MKGIIKTLLSKKLAVLASNKAISIAVAAVVVAGAGTGTAVIAYNHNKAGTAPQTQLLTSSNNKTVNNAALNNTATNTSNTAENSTNAAANNSAHPVAQATTSPAAPAADPNQAKYDAAKAKAGSRLSELLTDLKKLGYSIGASDTIDATNYAAILKFQNDNGLDADGLPGSATFAKLNAKLYPSSSSSSASKSSGSTTSNSGGTSSSGSGSTAAAKLPSVAEIMSVHSDLQFRYSEDCTSEIYTQLDNIFNNFASNHDATAGTNAMYAIHLNLQNGLYPNVHVKQGRCGSAILRPGMTEAQIGDAIGSCSPGNNSYSKFTVVENGDGTDTVYRLACYVTYDGNVY